MKCLAINKSADPVEVRVGYDGQANVLQGKGDHLRWETTLYPFKRSDEKLKPFSLEPGEEKVLFELKLDEILLQQPVPREKRKWRWDWVGHHQPPASPLYSYRKRGSIDKAMFWAKALVNDKQLCSEEVVLKFVSPGGGEKPIYSD